jgi:hypothetical protein
VQDYLPVLRNHRYKVNITDVHGRGYDTPRKAFDAMGLNTNLTVVITSTDNKVTEIVYDGQYMLGVERTKATLSKLANSTREVYINTDYPGGWTATKKTTTSTWLRLDVASGAVGGSGNPLKFTATTVNTGADRTETIIVQAGRLFMEIEVTQTTVSDIEISGKYAFYPLSGYDCTFTVKSNYDWKVRVEDAYNIVTGFTLSGVANNTTGATFHFTLVNDYALDKTLKDKTASFTFYSETGAFEPVTVTIDGSSTREFYSNDVINGNNYFEIYSTVAAGHLQFAKTDAGTLNWSNAVSTCAGSTL